MPLALADGFVAAEVVVCVVWGVVALTAGVVVAGTDDVTGAVSDGACVWEAAGVFLFYRKLRF